MFSTYFACYYILPVDIHSSGKLVNKDSNREGHGFLMSELLFTPRKKTQTSCCKALKMMEYLWTSLKNDCLVARVPLTLMMSYCAENGASEPMKGSTTVQTFVMLRLRVVRRPLFVTICLEDSKVGRVARKSF